MSCKVCVTILVVFSNTDYDSSFYRDKQYLFFCLFSMSGDQVDQTDHDHTRERGMRKVGGNTVIAGRHGQVQGSLRAHFLLKKRLFTCKHTGLLGLCSTRRGGGGVGVFSIP